MKDSEIYLRAAQAFGNGKVPSADGTPAQKLEAIHYFPELHKRQASAETKALCCMALCFMVAIAKSEGR